jgi:hypothetical protein
VLNRGFLYVVDFLIYNEVPLSEHLNAILPLVAKNENSELCLHLLAKLMTANATAFHPYFARMLSAATLTIGNGSLTPEFLRAFLSCYGLAAVIKLAAQVISRWICLLGSSPTALGLIEVVAPYGMHLSVECQIDLHKALVTLCEKRRFDSQLFEVTVMAMMSSSPTVSPFLGRFLQIIEKSANPRRFKTMLQPLLEPRGPPILHPMRMLMKEREVEMKDNFSQVTPQHLPAIYSTVEIQCDRGIERGPRKVDVRPPIERERAVIERVRPEPKKLEDPKEEGTGVIEMDGVALDMGDSDGE